jgi:hypothetical protein
MGKMGMGVVVVEPARDEGSMGGKRTEGVVWWMWRRGRKRRTDSSSDS